MTTDRFGVCYMGLSLDVAFAESVLHDLTADALGFNIPQSEVNSRFLVRFDGEPLVLANFTGASLLRHGADGQISTTLDYSITQAWSAAVHAHPQNVDGILYVSRHLNTGKAIAFYNRAGGKLRQGTTISLSQGLGLGAVLGRFGVQLA